MISSLCEDQHVVLTDDGAYRLRIVWKLAPLLG
jgi:hypothetical protein